MTQKWGGGGEHWAFEYEWICEGGGGGSTHPARLWERKKTNIPGMNWKTRVSGWKTHESDAALIFLKKGEKIPTEA